MKLLEKTIFVNKINYFDKNLFDKLNLMFAIKNSIDKDNKFFQMINPKQKGLIDDSFSDNKSELSKYAKESSKDSD